ncbi:MAG: AraC family transcriptional regulator [Clostridia bacterium]
MRQEILDKLIPITEEERRLLENGGIIDRSLYMEKNRQIVNSRKLLKEGKLITVRPHTRFVRFPEHTHDFVEVIYMCQGETTHIINEERVLLREGELLFLSQSARQEILPAGEGDIAVNFIILPEFFDSTLQMLGDEETPLRRFVLECLKKNGSTAGYLHFEVQDILPVQNLVENLIWTLIHDIPNKRKNNQITMGLLFLQLLNYTDRLSDRGHEESLIFEILRYIEENYRSGSLTEIADKLHYDFSWLSREIKRKTGKTYTELVQDKRLSQAAFLLKNTDMRISDIALQTGYDNISYFYRLWRKKFGVLPRIYRQTAGE